MKINVELIQSLQSILEAKQLRRVKLIKEFQEKIWNDESIKDERLNGILSELAYDFDFYEPNEQLRKEDPSYYGDDRLKEQINSVLQMIQKE